jgi:hypothetical protein
MLNKLIRVFKNDVIEFYCHPKFENVIPEPKPAIKYLPEWFRIIPPVSKTRRDEYNDFAMNAKKCFPMIDAMSLGYTIPLCGDLHVMVNNDMTEMNYTSPPEMKLADSHNVEQIGGESAPGFPINPIKFINYWIVKTAPGWSTLFIPPINHVGAPFTCLGGLVDTDRYPKEVNFPAIWNQPGFDGLIRAGTPLVTAIPIKRNSFPKKPKVRKIKNKEFNEIELIRKKQVTRKNVYTNELRDER